LRPFLILAFLSAFFAAPAGAAELYVVSPPSMQKGLQTLADDFGKETGNHMTAKSAVMGLIMPLINTNAPSTDVVLLPPDAMDTLEKAGGIKAGTRVPVARSLIGVAVRKGEPHPDISTLAKFRAVMLAAKMVSQTAPGPPRFSMEAAVIDRIWKRPDFAGVHVLANNDGTGLSALTKGDSDIALQAVSTINANKDVELVGLPPPEVEAWFDLDAAVSSRTVDAASAGAFIRYITRPEATPVWTAAGMERR
jgi:molybdate transport system substrate-binding protein